MTEVRYWTATAALAVVGALFVAVGVRAWGQILGWW